MKKYTQNKQIYNLYASPLPDAKHGRIGLKVKQSGVGAAYLSGQTILETVIAATLIAIAIVASMSLSTNTQKETSFSKDLSVATKYNYQVIDWVKNVQRSLGWAAFYEKISTDAGHSTYCFNSVPDLAIGFTSLAASNKDSCQSSPITGETSFYRLAEFNIEDANTINLKVTTYWSGNIEHSSSTETTITNH